MKRWINPQSQPFMNTRVVVSGSHLHTFGSMSARPGMHGTFDAPADREVPLAIGVTVDDVEERRCHVQWICPCVIQSIRVIGACDASIARAARTIAALVDRIKVVT